MKIHPPWCTSFWQISSGLCAIHYRSRTLDSIQEWSFSFEFFAHSTLLRDTLHCFSNFLFNASAMFLPLAFTLTSGCRMPQVSCVKDLINCVGSKILNHGLFSLFKFFWVKKHFKSTWKFRILIQIPFLFNIPVLLDVQADVPETSPFFVCTNGFGEHLFHMFIVLGMYNFVGTTNEHLPRVFIWLIVNQGDANKSSQWRVPKKPPKYQRCS